MTDTPNNTTPTFTPAPDLSPASEAPAFTPAPDLPSAPETTTPPISTPISTPFCPTITKEVLVADKHIMPRILQAMAYSEDAREFIETFCTAEFTRSIEEPVYRIWRAQDSEVTVEVRERGNSAKDWQVRVQRWD